MDRAEYMKKYMKKYTEANREKLNEQQRKRRALKRIKKLAGILEEHGYQFINEINNINI